MAYADFKEDEEDLAGGGPVVAGGAGGPLSPSAQASAKAGATTQPKGSGQFADLNEYLRVNTPQQFGSQLAGKVGNEVTQGQQTLDNTSNEFKSRVDANTVKDTQGAIGQLDTNPEGIDTDYFAKLRDAQYKGPSSFSDAQDLYNQASGAADTAVNKSRASKTEGGRFALLDNYFGRPNYTQGQKSLDNLLVQNDQGSQAAFDQVRQNAQTLADNAKNVGSGLNTYAALGRGQTEQTRNQARQGLGIDDAGNQVQGVGALGALEGGVNQKVKSAQDKQAADTAAIKDAFAKGSFNDLTADQKSLLGVPSEISGFDTYYGADPNAYLQAGDLNAGNVASAQDYARYKALANLSGLEGTFLSDPSRAGTGKGVTYDFGALQKAISEGEQNYQTDLNKQLGEDFSFTPYTSYKDKPGTPVGQLVNGANDTIFAALAGENYTPGSKQQKDAIKAAYQTSYSAPQKLELMQSVLPKAEAMVAKGTLKKSYVDALKAEISAAKASIDSINKQYGVKPK